MNKNIIKKITATAFCGVLALTSVVTANSAVKVKAVTDVGKSFTLADGQLGATAFNLDSNDSVYAEFRKEKGGLTKIDFVPLVNKVKTYNFSKTDKYNVMYLTNGGGGGSSSYRNLFRTDLSGKYVKVRVKLHDLDPKTFSEKGTTKRDSYNGKWEFNYKTQRSGKVTYYSYLIIESGGFMTACAPNKDGYVEFYLSRKLGHDTVYATSYGYETDTASGGGGGTTGTYIDKLTMGNANGDWWVNIMDVTEIQKYILGAAALDDFGIYVSDVNNDGVINILDATLVQKYIVEAYS